MRIKILLATHGQLGAEFISAAVDIMGRGEDICFFGITRTMTADEIRAEFTEKLTRMLKDSAVIILTDMPGGTPANMALAFLDNDRVEVITGVNLPMLLTALHRRAYVKDIKELADAVSRAAVKGIVNCGESFNE